MSYGTSTNWVTGTQYYPTYTQTKVTFGTGDNDVYGVDQTTGRMNSFQFTVGSTPQTLSGTPGWNQNGTLGTLNITDPFNSSNTQNCGYAYDDLARINSVNCLNGSTNVFNQSFTLDPFGNISKSGTASFAASYLLSNGTTNNQEQSVGSCVPTYDANGNMTKDCSFSSPPKYTWDSDGNPVQVRSANLTFDALDREVEFANGSAITQVLYGPIGKMGLMNGQTPSITRIPLPGGSTAKMVGTNGTTYIMHNDWLGSARLTTAYSTRSMYYDTAYAPYGENYSSTSTSMSNLDFTGQFQDTMNGLYDFLYREYDPVQGRWISPDPAGLNAVDPVIPQSWNRYAYVVNNPLFLVDPAGLDDCDNTDDGEFVCDGDSGDAANFGEEFDGSGGNGGIGPSSTPKPDLILFGVGNCEMAVLEGGQEGAEPGYHYGGFFCNGGGQPLQNTNCITATRVQKAAISVAATAAKFYGKTVLWGLGGSGGAGFGKGIGTYGSASLQIAVSPNGNAAYVLSLSLPAAITGAGTYPYFLTPSTKGAGVLGGAQFGYSNASDPSELSGRAVDASGSLAAGIGIGGDLSVSGSTYQANVTLGFGLGGRSGAGAITNTFTSPICR